MSDENRKWYIGQSQEVQTTFLVAAQRCAIAMGDAEGAVTYWLDALIGIARASERSAVSP